MYIIIIYLAHKQKEESTK